MSERRSVTIFYGIALAIVILIAWQLGPALLATPGTPTAFVVQPTQAVVAQPTIPYVADDEATTRWQERAGIDALMGQPDGRDQPVPDDGWCGTGRLAYEC